MSWNPTHVQVAIQRAKDLISKGKNGTNDAFCTIALKSEKYQTSIKDRAIDPEWYEECDVLLPGNYHEEDIQLTLYHRNNMGIDEFLGRAQIPLGDFDVYDAPRAIWYNLLCKPGQNKSKPRGELEVRLSFVVNKAKDLDSISTASSASKRLKMSKKAIKHATSALGKKIKGSKTERTSDYVPDLTGLDTGIVFDDIAENYTSAAVVTGRKTSDSLSLASSSPIVKKHSKFSPFTKRRSKAEDSETSSHASVEDVYQGHDGSDMSWKTHRRGGSDSNRSDVVAGKPPKPNRRQLTAGNVKAQSTWDISNTKSEFEFGTTAATVSADDSVVSRARTVTSASHSSNDALPKVDESPAEGVDISMSYQQRKTLAASKEPIQRPVLVDEDSDSSAEDIHLPTSKPAKLKPVEEPTDMFTNLDEKMAHEKEEESSISMVANKSSNTVDNDVFTPMPKQPQLDTQKHSTPKVISSDDAVKASSQVNVFDFLMASDEPETCIDDTNPFEEDMPVDSKNPFETSLEKSSDAGNPFYEEDHIVLAEKQSSNPFEDQTNPFDESNFHLEETEKQAPVKPSRMNPDVATADIKNSFKVESSLLSAQPDNNPFNESLTNPFDEDDDDDIESNTYESFNRVGSNRFGRSGRKSSDGSKVRKKTAPPPPKLTTVDTAKIQLVEKIVQNEEKKPTASSPADSPRQSLLKKKAKKAPKAPKSFDSKVTILENTPISASSSLSPRGRSTSQSTDNSPIELSGNKSRSYTDAGRLESTLSRLGSGNSIVIERQPAVGAESPEMPPALSERSVTTAEIGVQVAESQDSLPSEFRMSSKQELVEVIQRMRSQLRKKDDLVHDLEEYIDTLLLRIMSADPNLLVSQQPCAQQVNKTR